MPAQPSTYLSKKAAFVFSLMASQIDAAVFGVQKPIKIKRSNPYQLGDSLAGYGYSLDSQKIVDEQCYNATAGLPEGTNSVVSLNEATSFSDFESSFSYSVKAGVSFGIFSASADARYMKKVSDKDFSLSLNYYSYSSGTVRVQTGIGQDALTDAGKQEYSNNLTNPYFGVVCGDETVTSYQQGALLAMALKIEFQSHMDKEQFEASASAGLGSIFSASTSVQSITSHYKMNGRVSLIAYQQGGDPGQLAKILSKDSGGNYYISSCSITDMDACKNASSGLLDYASSDFPNQFSVSSGQNLTTLGFGFYDTQPIEYIGLVPPKSLLDNTTLQARDTVADAYAQQLCYQDKFYSLFNGYPVSWQSSSAFYQKMTNASDAVKANIAVILGNNQPSGKGLEDCYLTPDRCSSIIQTIQSGIQSIDFAFLQLLEYYYKSVEAIFYYSGMGWEVKPLEDGYDTVNRADFSDDNNISYNISAPVSICSLTPSSLSVSLEFFSGRLQADNITIEGTAEECPEYPRKEKIYHCKSPFFFDELARCDSDTSSRVSRKEADVCSIYPS